MQQVSAGMQRKYRTSVHLGALRRERLIGPSKWPHPGKIGKPLQGGLRAQGDRQRAPVQRPVSTATLAAGRQGVSIKGQM